jgi:hypothetical protein
VTSRGSPVIGLLTSVSDVAVTALSSSLVLDFEQSEFKRGTLVQLIYLKI